MDETNDDGEVFSQAHVNIKNYFWIIDSIIQIWILYSNKITYASNILTRLAANL